MGRTRRAVKVSIEALIEFIESGAVEPTPEVARLYGRLVAALADIESEEE